MPPEALYQRNEFLIVAALFALLLLTAEVSFRRGRTALAPLDGPAKDPMTMLQGALAGLLSLLLAFTFAMAVSRFEERQQVLVQEANAIGTAALRAQSLAEPYRATATDLFQKYIDARLRTYDAQPDSPSSRQAQRDTFQLQQQLWQIAKQTGAKDPNLLPSGLFITALNEVIDLQAKRDTVRVNHVPEPALLLLFVVALLTMGLIGYGCGGGGHRHFGAMIVVAAAISLTILVIIDLDRPLRGLIRVPQQNILDLRDHPVWRDPAS